MKPTEGMEKPSRDGIALIIGGIFILTLVFAAYNYFTNTKKDALLLSDDGDEVFIKSEEKSDDDDQKVQGDLNGEGAASQRNNVAPTMETKQVVQTSDGGWVANNYNPGDIKAGSYTVIKGDTLWEIAEGAYTYGSNWTKIRDANLSEIGFLPNGVRALIKAGQVLVLP